MTTSNEDLIDRLYDWHNTSAEQNRLDMQKAADLLQSQAERIKELESECLNTDVRLATAIESREQMRDQLAEIAATEPSMIYHGRCVIDCGDSGHHDVTMLKMIARETKLFTRPMPAQGVEASMINLPEPVELNPAANSVMGHSDATLKQAVRDALDTQDVEDAARYRWIRLHCYVDTFRSHPRSDLSMFDAAIDAARAKGAK